MEESPEKNFTVFLRGEQKIMFLYDPVGHVPCGDRINSVKDL
jgi:hypothetical protein